MSVEFDIIQNLKQEAVNHSRERMNYEYNRFGLSDNKRESMILIGTIGQLIFKEFLDCNSIKYDFEYQAGKYDELDFEIKGNIYEVKTSGYEDSYAKLNLLYSKDQFRRGVQKKYSYCVQIFINGYNRQTKLLELNKCNKATIVGYFEFSKINDYKQHRQYYGDDYKVPLSVLKDIKQLLGVK